MPITLCEFDSCWVSLLVIYLVKLHRVTSRVCVVVSGIRANYSQSVSARPYLLGLIPYLKSARDCDSPGLRIFIFERGGGAWRQSGPGECRLGMTRVDQNTYTCGLYLTTIAFLLHPSNLPRARPFSSCATLVKLMARDHPGSQLAYRALSICSLLGALFTASQDWMDTFLPVPRPI